MADWAKNLKGVLQGEEEELASTPPRTDRLSTPPQTDDLLAEDPSDLEVRGFEAIKKIPPRYSQKDDGARVRSYDEKEMDDSGEKPNEETKFLPNEESNENEGENLISKRIAEAEAWMKKWERGSESIRTEPQANSLRVITGGGKNGTELIGRLCLSNLAEIADAGEPKIQALLRKLNKELRKV